MIFCVSSGGALLENAERLNVPYLRVPGGMPPRAALPYLFVPLLLGMEKMGLVSGASEELSEALTLLEKIGKDNSPEKPAKENFSKTLALNIGQTAPVVYGFGFYRSVAQRFKTQFNENSKVPAKWEVFSELNHNEIVGWERAVNSANASLQSSSETKRSPPKFAAELRLQKSWWAKLVWDCLKYLLKAKAHWQRCCQPFASATSQASTWHFCTA